MGDFADLRRLARWSSGLGAGLLLLNPVHAATPVTPHQASPYSPTSRLYRNPLYLRVEEIPGAGESDLDLERLAALGRALNRERRIDRDAVFRLKMDAFATLWSRARLAPAFERYRREQGPALESFATFCALAEEHGPDWRAWPAEYRRPESPATARFAATEAHRVHFHQWLQWLLDEQLERAGTEIAVMHDLPIGVDPGGADAWIWQDVIVTGATMGAPPDTYSHHGQDWGLPPFAPRRLAAVGYEPFIQTIRATLRHAGGLRIDHVMGFFRLFWIPGGWAPQDGAYVRYPAEDFLAIVALESHRARAIIVGEDLGIVEAGVRERLAAQAILLYRLMWFEREPPARYPELALSAVTTHDLPTIAGVWSGADLKAQTEIGRQPNEDAWTRLREILREQTGLAEDASNEDVIERTYAALGQAPSMIVTATLDDALAVAERPNMPGTVTEWPNWSLALPVPLEQIETERLPRKVAAALARRAPTHEAAGRTE